MPASSARRSTHRPRATTDRSEAASNLAWLNRCQAGKQIELSCLKLGPAILVHMPGELFVEYQLAAQAMRPDVEVCLAAYGDYGPGYIGTTERTRRVGMKPASVRHASPPKSSQAALLRRSWQRGLLTNPLQILG